MRCHPAAETIQAREPNVRRISFELLAVLFAVEKSSPTQRGRKLPRATNKWHFSQPRKMVGHHSSQHTNKDHPGVGKLPTNISRHAHPWLGPDRPLTPDSIPPRRNGRPCGANPNADKRHGARVYIKVWLERDDIVEAANAEQINMAILANATSQQIIINSALATSLQHLLAASH